MRQRLLGGRIRTSTAVLALVFIVTLVAYILVRPAPASVVDTRQPPSKPAPARPWAPSRPTHSPTATPTPPDRTPSPTATQASPDSTPTTTPSPSIAPTTGVPSPTP